MVVVVGESWLEGLVGKSSGRRGLIVMEVKEGRGREVEGGGIYCSGGDVGGGGTFLWIRSGAVEGRGGRR